MKSTDNIIHYIEYNAGTGPMYQIVEQDFSKESIWDQRTIVFQTDDYDEVRDTLDQVRELQW